MLWVIVYISFAGASLGLGYWFAAKFFGDEVASRNMRYMAPFFVATFAIAFLTPLLVPLGGSILLAVIVASVFVWLLSWPYRKRGAGNLLLNAGRPSQNKLIFWVGIFQGLVASYFTSQLFFEDLPSSEAGITSLIGAICWWMLTIFFLAIGLNKLEFRANGICFQYMFIAWRRMKSYSWDRSKPNTLTVHFAPLWPLLPGFISIKVPNAHRDSVDDLVATHLSNLSP